MKRSPMPRRTSSISRHVSIKAVNRERKAKRKARKPRLKASVRKAVLIRDGNQCTFYYEDRYRPTLEREPVVDFYRCPETENLQVHEKRYPAEVEDCETLCKWHHMQLEAKLRPWNFR